jgi:hypothetical protein
MARADRSPFDPPINRGSEGGVVLRDEEHPAGARITLERDTRTAPYAITCGVYGWMVDTRFFPAEREANAEYEAMKEELGALASIDTGTPENAKMEPMVASIHRFIERFP